MQTLNPFPLFCGALAVFLSACISTDRHPGDFVQTTDFHILQSFTIGEIELSGMESTESMGESLTETTRSELAAELERRGFPDSGSEADFIVRADWKKALRVKLRTGNAFDEIPEMSRQDEDRFRPQVLCSLTVELYDPKKDVVFWRAKMPDCLDVLRVNEDNVVAIIKKVMASFPQRIQLDPNLRTIE